jgi:hypothetical protein
MEIMNKRVFWSILRYLVFVIIVGLLVFFFMDDDKVNNLILVSIAVVIIIRITSDVVINFLIKDTTKNRGTTLIISVIVLTIWILFITDHVTWEKIVVVSSFWINYREFSWSIKSHKK